ncbi:hypothetical protein P153DRAFT_323007 [Dothidotthia symphoricarpi CBS 119687]|uniref:Uncharacterized protein n=1 Tax=Dothidotthia symphoricarpi CBS 119687 TaxID=1392245 RepID=A0A6A6A4G4_9PLEO|nr:uncharacterized protein P153DRAFT_323007 [Dothidotthia symphoricarpi CBS 119687]KAF2126043.1 hypothetical protein P153DRAFT_323007 [Dothidotthia symphoricarpi CBS 119687]
MSAPEVDTNQWYYLYVNNNKDSAMLGSPLYSEDGTRGAVFFNATDTSADNMRWQIFPVSVNSSVVYTFRSKRGGSNAFIGTAFNSAEDTEGNTQPGMVRGDVADTSVYWTFGAWGDGTWWLSNAQNGTGYHMTRKPSTLMAMDPNITAPQNGQRWGLSPIAKINDPAYSSINLLGATAMAATTTSSTPSSTSTSTSVSVSASASSSTSPSPSAGTNAVSGESTGNTPSGLSTGAKAGIGAGVGVAVLIALVVLALFLRKRKQRRAAYTPPPSYNNPQEVAGAPLTKYELYHDGATKHEMPNSGHDVAEIMSQDRPVELPGSTVTKK